MHVVGDGLHVLRGALAGTEQFEVADSVVSRG